MNLLTCTIVFFLGFFYAAQLGCFWIKLDFFNEIRTKKSYIYHIIPYLWPLQSLVWNTIKSIYYKYKSLD